MTKTKLFQSTPPQHRKSAPKTEHASKRQRMLEACGFSQRELSDMVAAMMG